MKRLWVSKNTYFLAMALGAGLLSLAQDANAADQDVQATVQTRQAIAMTLNTDMDFGMIDYVAVHSGNIQLGTNGSVTLAGGATGLTVSGGTPTAGDVTVTGDGTSTADISCETGGTLDDGAAHTLTLVSTEVAVGAGVAFGAADACAGLGTPVATTIDFSSTATAHVLMGGAINTTANPIDGSATYSTAVGGGNPVTLRVVYQ